MQAKAIRDTQAGLFFGPDAVRSGFADSLASTEQVVSEFAAYLGAKNVRGIGSRVISASAMDALSSVSLSLQTNPKDPTKEICMNPETKNDPAPADPENETAVSDPMQRKDSAPAEEAREKAPALVPAPTPAVPDNTVAAAVQSAKAEAVAQAISIAELCQLAGQSHRTASFLTQGLSASQVRQTLLASRAQSEEITSLIAPDAAPKGAGTASDAGALMAAVKKLTQKN
jgi:hypothetical protein